MKYVDLHIHSYYSDGLDTPIQIVRAAKIKGLDMIAIADHDNLRGYFRALDESKKWGIDLVPAVEITTIEHHLLALNFHPENREFKQYIEHSREVHEGVCSQRIDLLKNHGIPITFEKVKKAFSTSSLGKYSILWTMLLDNECRKYLEQKHGKLAFHEIYNTYLNSSGIAGKVERKRVITWAEAAREVKKAGGLVIVPHPGKDLKISNENDRILKTADGIEVQPRFVKESLPFVEYAKKTGKIITYGSDYHSSYGGSQILGKNENKLEDSVANLFKR